MNNFTKVSQHQQRIDTMLHELDCGLKLLGFEQFDIGTFDGKPSISYKNDQHVIVFYVTNYDVVDMKITEPAKRFKTSIFKCLGVKDVQKLITLAVNWYGFRKRIRESGLYNCHDQ